MRMNKLGDDESGYCTGHQREVSIGHGSLTGIFWLSIGCIEGGPIAPEEDGS